MRDEDAVEGLFVDRRQSLNRDRVFAGDGEFYTAVCERILAEDARINWKVFAAYEVLDRDLSYVRGTEEQDVVGITQKIYSRF